MPNFIKTEALLIASTKLGLKFLEVKIMKFNLHYHKQRHWIIHYVYFHLNWRAINFSDQIGSNSRQKVKILKFQWRNLS